MNNQINKKRKIPGISRMFYTGNSGDLKSVTTISHDYSLRYAFFTESLFIKSLASPLKTMAPVSRT